jgi:hypothetical protein
MPILWGFLPAATALLLAAAPAARSSAPRGQPAHVSPAGAGTQTRQQTSAGIEGVRYADQFPGSDIGARVNAAIASLPGGGRVVIPAGTYCFSTTILINRPVRLVGEGVRATVLHYTGPGDAIRVEAGSAPPYLNGALGHMSIVGSSSPDAVGVHQVDTVGFDYHDLAVVHFRGAGGAGIWMDNEPPSYCPTCQTGFSERTEWDRVSFFENTVGLEFSNSGGTNSFEYSWMWAVHFQINNGQTGIWLAGTGRGSVALQHSDLEFMANICLTEPLGPGGTVASVTGGAGWYQGFIHATAEQSCGRTPGTMWRVDSASYLDAWGAYHAYPLANHIAAGGIFLFGLYGPTQVSGTDHLTTNTGLSVPLGVDGDPSPTLAGAGDVALAGRWKRAGQLNESIGFGADTAAGAATAGLGFEYGLGIQHPLSWCYRGDVTGDCFAWYSKPDPTTPLSAAPGAWLTSSPTWEFFADAYGSKSPAAAQAGVLRLASSDAIDWRNAANTGDIALRKNASDQLDVSGFAALVVPRIEVSGKATVRLPSANGTLALASQLPLAGTTGPVGGAALQPGQCTSGSAAVAGATPAMAVVATPTAYPGDGFFWEGYVSAPGRVAVKLCAVVGGRPASGPFNVRVIR